MYYNLNLIDQIQRILDKNYTCMNTDFTKPSNHISDVIHGEIYQSILKSHDGSSIKEKKAFTFMLNTDGINVSLKSKLTIWPIYLVINELPIEKLYCIDNVVIAGNVNIFFK